MRTGQKHEPVIVPVKAEYNTAPCRKSKAVGGRGEVVGVEV